jgi:protein SCO1/2
MNQTQNNTRFLLLAISLAILAALAGALLWKMLEIRQQQNLQSLIVLPEPKIVADFALLDESAQDYSLADLEGRWSLLFFGFTACPDVCPNTLYQLKQVRTDLLAELDESEIPIFYLVSVDPDRDSPQALADYLQYFDPAFKGLTGDDPQLRALTMQLGIAYHVEDHQPGDKEYMVDHSASLILMNPKAQLYGVFPAPQQAAQISNDLLQVLD